MARILFAWELGGGLGHTLVHMGLARHLRAAGHQVLFAIRDLAQAEEVFGRQGFHYLQAPVRMRPVTEPVSTSVTYPQILHNIGFSDPAGLLAQVKAWRLLYSIVQPAMVIYDHSPTALLAASDLDMHKVHIGTGFTVPPRATPFPRLAAPRKKESLDPVAAERGVLESINRVRDQLKLAPIGEVAAMLATDEDVLLTFAELDHYGPRDDARYWGDGSRDEGDVPRWPPGTGKRIFAYLKPFKTLGSLLESLAAKGLPTLIYGPQIPLAMARRYASASLHFCANPLDLARVGRECDLAILNGTHGTTAGMLLSGCPSLQLPLNLEQLITAGRVQELGAGLSAPLLKPEGMGAKLNALLENGNYRAAAQQFGARYGDFDLADRNEKIALRLASRLDFQT